MTMWAWMLVAAIVVVAIPGLVVVGGIVRNRGRTRRLKQRNKLDLVPLTATAISNFTIGWQEVQANFVDNPATAVDAADRLVTEVMRERGYPVDDFDRRTADISVDHPEIADSYRAARGISTSQHDAVSTEQQRDAFMHYRTLFEKLLERAKADARSQEASA